MAKKYNMFTGGYYDDVEKSRDLKDIELAEVSFVDKPANKRGFLFFKGNETMDKLEELLSIFEKVEFDNDIIEKSLKAFTKLDFEERDAIAETIVALAKLYHQPEVKKSIDDKWPSLDGLVFDESEED